jgi:hypothetical protein
MNKKTKHFVTFYYPGALVGESCTREIDKRDPRKALDYKVSKGSYGFCFYSVNYADLDDGEYKSEKFEQTGTFFIYCSKCDDGATEEQCEMLSEKYGGERWIKQTVE